uniref:Uncharacterized protein n=1 Tax=Pseudomonas phage Cygsa01 TaxID=3138529 RepID=A0AAU6W412_9VIRU
MSRTLRRKGESQFRSSHYFITDDDLNEDGLVNIWYEKRVNGKTQAEANRVKRALFHADGNPWGTGPGKQYRRQLKAIQKNELRALIAHCHPDQYEDFTVTPHCNDWAWW